MLLTTFAMWAEKATNGSGDMFQVQRGIPGSRIYARMTFGYPH